MLLYQGLASFKLWTGIEVDEKIFSVEELQSLVDRGV
jgi:shikimate 5-dehydrogenase